MRSIWKKAIGVAAASAAIAAGGAGLASADNTVPDGDNTTPVAADPLAFGTVCINSSTDAHALVAVSRNGSATGTNTFHNGATLTVSVQGVTGTGLSASMDASSITLPGDWQSLSNNTLSDAVSSKVSLAAGSAAGTFSGTVTYRISGTNADGNSINRDATMLVSATVSETGACAPAPSDTTAPVVTVSFPSPVSGSNGWFNADDITPVVGSVTASDASNVTNISCTGAALSDETGYGTSTASGVLTVSGDGTHSVSCTATDGASPSNTGAGAGSVNTATIKIDTVAPSISDDGFDSGTAGNIGWYISVVTEDFSATDATSGVACTTPWTATSTTEGSSVKIASGTCSDAAGNTAASIDSTPYKIDLTNPTVVCDPAPTFTLNQSPADVSATVTDSGSGPISPATAPADTSSIGASKSVAVTGYDVAGLSTTVSCSYSVIYNWTGFFQPVDNNGVFNVAKAGSAIPVKFSLSGYQGLNIFTAGSPSSRQVNCTSSEPTDTIEATVTAGGSSLSYDATSDQYNYVWKTDKSWAGTCRQLTVALNDGTSHTANFKFTK